MHNRGEGSRIDGPAVKGSQTLVLQTEQAVETTLPVEVSVFVLVVYLVATETTAKRVYVRFLRVVGLHVEQPSACQQVRPASVSERS